MGVPEKVWRTIRTRYFGTGCAGTIGVQGYKAGNAGNRTTIPFSAAKTASEQGFWKLRRIGTLKLEEN